MPCVSPPPPVPTVTDAAVSTQRRSLSRTLPIVVLLFTVVPLLVAGLLSLADSAQRLRHDQAERTRQTVELLAARVDQLAKSAQRTAASIAASPPVAALPADEQAVSRLREELTVVLASHPELDHATVVDAAGRVVAQALRGGAPATAAPLPGAAADAPSGPLGAPTASAGEAGHGWRLRPALSGMDWVYPAVGGSSVIVGLPADALHESMRPAASQVEARLLDRAGETIARTGPQQAVDERDAVVAEAPVGETGWTVRLAEPLTGYRAALREEFLRFGALAFAVSVLSAWAAWRFARGLAADVRQVARAARAILRGHYLNAHVQLQRDDELGVLADSFNHMSRELETRERERDVFGRLVSPEVRDQLLQGELMLGGHEVEVTVLLSDIRGFTQLCERMQPRDVVLTLNEYFTRMTDAVQRYGGYINNFMGDAMVVVFGAPKPDAHRVERALYAAVAMQRALADFNAERVAYGAPRLRMGIGLASGTALAGQIGSPERCIYTVIGDTVNIAARLEGLSKEHPRMIAFVNETTRALLPAPLAKLLVPMGEQQLKGRGQGVAVYGLPVEADLPPAGAHLLREDTALEPV